MLSMNTSTSITLTILVEVCVILLGALLVTDAISLPTPPLYIDLLVMFSGTLLLATAWLAHSAIGLLLFTYGTYATLRSVDAVSKSWFQYGLGVTLVLLGTALILYQAIGGATMKEQHAHDIQSKK